MESMPDGYTDAVMSPNRTIDIFLTVGIGADTTAADDLESVGGSFLPFSNTDQVIDAIYYLTLEPATFEGYGIKTSADNGLVAPPLQPIPYPPELGVWSDVISDKDGAIDFTFSVTLSQAHTSAFQVYTEGPAVTAATATFTLEDGSTVTRQCTCVGDYFNVPEVFTYTAISIAISKLDAPYRHVRIVEVEFGASRAFSNSELGGEVSIIREIDPTEQTMPMDELDVSVINVLGELDPDHPSSRLDELCIGQSFVCSFTVTAESGKRFTVPCGRYWIGERDSTDTRLELTAFDVRYKLSTIYAEWSIDAAKSLGQTLGDLFTDYQIPHIVDEDLYSVMPDTLYTFDDSTPISDDLLQLQQAYAIYCIPDREGSIRVTSTWPGDAWGTVPVGTIYSWPSPKQQQAYNYISIGYTVTSGDVSTIYYVETDLRTDQTEGKNILQIGNNPLITTSTRATALMTRIISRLYTEEVEAEWRGDPAMDLGDTVSIPGRWTQSDPRSYGITYMEEVYDGGFRVTMRGTR